MPPTKETQIHDSNEAAENFDGGVGLPEGTRGRFKVEENNYEPDRWL